MLEWLEMSQLVDLIAILAAFLGATWVIRSSIANLGERLAHVDAELKSFKEQTSEYQKRNDERMDKLDQRISNLYGSVSRIEGHLFGGKPAPAEEDTQN